MDTVDDWKDRFPGIIKDYEPEEIYNMDETGLFFRALPDKTLTVKGADCDGGKKSKERLTVALCVNAVGEVETPLVIGHAENPRCFRNINKTRLPVTLVASKRAWMTAKIFTTWIMSFNKKMRANGRHVLLLLDNASCHPEKLELSNVTIRFLTANTTSVLQSLDLGVIKNMRCHYRSRLLRAMLARVEISQSASEISRSLNVLQPCHWISQAVNAETVQKCFGNGGVTPQPDTEFPNEDDVPLSQLVSAVSDQLNPEKPLSMDNYRDINVGAPATEELPDGWERQLAADIRLERGADNAELTLHLDLNSDEDTCDSTSTPVSRPSFMEAMHAAALLKDFAADRGLDSILHAMLSVEDELQDSFFHQDEVCCKAGNHRQFLQASVILVT